MSARKLAVLSAGMRVPSSTRLLADRLTEAPVAALGERGVGSEVHVVELREHAHEVLDAVLSGFPPPALRDDVDAVVHADGLIAVTPIFAVSYNGLFKL